MGKKSAKAPEPPNPQQIAKQQYQMNADTARLMANMNRVNEFNPFGSSEYTDLGGDKWRRDVKLSPEMQAAYARVMPNVGQDLDLSSLGELPDASVGGLQNVGDAIYNRYRARLDPRYQQMESDLDAKLANQGISMGSEAYQRERGNFMRGRADDYQQAMDQALINAGQEQARLFGLGMGKRQQGLQEILNRRQIPISEFAQFLPQFGGTPQTQVQPTDLSGNVWNAYNAQMNAYNQQQQQNSGMMGDLFSLAGTVGGAMIMASSRHLKQDFGVIDTIAGLPIHLWRYKGKLDDGIAHIGPMADDWSEKFGGDGLHIPRNWYARLTNAR